ncbi:heparinase II/III domain-containing protein [Zhihengliuella halotolerans]|uniref:Heparinase II/III-like protein n=1 Tax=Zhihengliuella halotolerans TaxID=370736 RepID=A0A4Q8AD90_9MICC|nr:heparinase II/III family protein [Zhihengliuella halotolerans]RZU61593.1 heparinase II/III-like protein [Zhihengliuella halotolerans]
MNSTNPDTTTSSTHDSDVDLASYSYRALPQRRGTDSIEAVEAFLTGGSIRAPRFGDIDYDDGAVWQAVGDRTHDRFLHGFLFLADWTEALEEGDERAGVAVLDLIDRWVGQNGFDPAASPHPLAYHDETTAQRLMHWLLVERNLSRSDNGLDLSVLRAAIDNTASVLLRDDFHAGWNNHGMFQDLALRHYSEMARWNEESHLVEFRSTALERLHGYFSTCFTVDGVHVENSPTYHQMICRFLTEHVAYLHLRGITDSQLDDILEKASVYATHVVTPAGTHPLLSDSVSRSLLATAGKLFDSSNYDFAVTQGRKGTVPKDVTLLLPESGYAIHRSRWADREATWVMLTAAYNSNYHKHSDDLSLVVHGAGQPLVSEAGPYGYNYSDPMTVYGFSQFAHNNIVLDRKSVRRVDDYADTVRFIHAEKTAHGFDVTAETGRLTGGTHRREVSVATGEQADVIRVVDTVEGERDDHTWEMFWNLAPNLLVVPHGQGFEAFRDGVKVLDAFFEADVPTQVSVHRGETKPRVLGWAFPEFGEAEPASVVRVSFKARCARVASRFAVRGDFNYADLALVEGKNQWRRAGGEPQLNYLLDLQEGPSPAPLVVVFSAISPLGRFTYNYRSSLQDLPVNVLYILDDFGDQGCYYLSDHGSRAIAHSVQALIGKVVDDLQIGREHVYFAGSSKGGAAALYHGIEFAGGGIVVGAPQTRIGSFLEKPHPNVLKFMTGGTGQVAVAELDAILFEQVQRQSTIPRVDLLVGDADHHYRNHVLPWVRHAEEAGHTIGLEVVPGTPHSDVGPVFKNFLRSKITALAARVGAPHGSTASAAASGLSSGTSSLPQAQPSGAAPWINLSVAAGSSTLRLSVSGAEELQVSLKLYRANEVVDTIEYGDRRDFSWDSLEAGRYRARVYYRERGGEAQAVTSSWCEVA